MMLCHVMLAWLAGLVFIFLVFQSVHLPFSSPSISQLVSSTCKFDNWHSTLVPCRELYLKKFPEAFYVTFGDFNWFVMDEIIGGRLNGGFARAKSVRSS
jgi:hypothetical protein